MKKVVSVILAAALAVSVSVTAFAANFTPSVQSKPAPDLAQVTDSNGTPRTAIAKDAQGNEKAIPEGVELTITAVAGANESVIPEVEEMLKKAEQQILSVTDLSQLTADLPAALEKAKEETQNELNKTVKVEDLVVRDLFDVSFVKDGKTLEQLLAEGETVTFALQTNLTNDDMFFILHNYEGDKWEVVENTKLQDNGVLEITVGGLSPFALVVNGSADLPVDPEGPTSPQTGHNFPMGYVIGALVLAGAGIVLFVKARKQRAH